MISPPPDHRRPEKIQAFDRLLTIMDELRLNCPWDMKQTQESLRHLTIEETYELADSILKKDSKEIEKELGDVLLHIIFYAKIASETGDYDIADVINKLCEKLIHRHPHIYGTVEVKDEEEVRRNWEALKKNEGNKSTLAGVPVSLPPMVKAMRIQEKARGAGFDWEEPSQVWEKVKEEIDELKTELSNPVIDQNAAEKELGDVFFSLINYARFMGLNPDQALERTNLKFISRFNHIEKRAEESGKSLHEMNLTEMEILWEEAKAREI